MASNQPVIPANESDRLAELVDLGILDTESEEVFDGLTKLAASICGTPIALVSLVDADRQWFKSRVGLAATETPREIAFCAHAINDPEQLFVVPDALEDGRFKSNPLVTSDPNIRFYAGMPIRTKPGSAIGTLCVLDRVPRELSDAQRESLMTIAGAVGAQLNLRREISIAKTLDAVTGLPNSFAFERKFIAAAPHLCKGGLLLIGMERLNKIAAALGSGATDAILKHSAQRLKAAIPDGTILAFFRRGLFVVFVPDAGPAKVSDFATQRLVPALAAPYTISIGTEEQQIYCPPHIGASFFPDDGKTVDNLLISAEQALQSARNVDEPFRAYDKSTDEIAGQHFRLEADLCKALDQGEFVNYYQPKIDLATGKICGAEALILDRAFVIKMTTDPAYLGIVNTIISLAHNLNFKVVAEGVETEEQANLLRLLKCDQAQGYLYSRPVSAENFSALLTSS